MTTRNLGGKPKRNGYYFHHDIAYVYSLSITLQLSPDLRDPFTEVMQSLRNMETHTRGLRASQILTVRHRSIQSTRASGTFTGNCSGGSKK